MFIFFVMPIIVIATIKMSQNTVTFSQTIGIIDHDSSTGYYFNDSFSYTTLTALQSEWEYNASTRVYLNLTAGQINFTTSHP